MSLGRLEPQLDVCEGWVWKRGNLLNSQYQKRWFLLRGGVLRYFKSKEEAASSRAEAQGTLSVARMHVEGDTGTDQGPEGPLAGFAITPAAVAENRGHVRRIQCGVSCQQVMHVRPKSAVMMVKVAVMIMCMTC